MKQTKLVIILSILTALFLISTLVLWRLYTNEKSAKEDALANHQNACALITKLNNTNETLWEESTGLTQSVDRGTVSETAAKCK